MELLDHVTSLLYNNGLPSTVFGERRYDLLTRFQSHVGEAFVPPAVEPSIAWGPYDPIHPTDCSEFEWDVKSMPHIPVGITRDKNEDLRLTGPQREGPVSLYGESVSNDKHSVHAPCNPSGFPVEHNSVGSEQDVSPRPVSPIRRPKKRKSSSDAIQDPSVSHADYSLGGSIASFPSGCKWYNNSCPYDSILFVLANTWKSDPVRYAECFEGINIEWMGELSKSLQLHIEGKYSLEQVRDFMRRKLHREFPGVFIYGKETSPGAIIEKWFTSSTPFMTVSSRCINGHVTRPVHYYSCGITPSSTSRNQNPYTIDQYLTSTQQYPSRITCRECEGATRKIEQYLLCPELLPVYIEGIDTEPDQTFSMQSAGESVRYCLSGVIYYGTAHFTARYVDRTGTVLI